MKVTAEQIVYQLAADGPPLTVSARQKPCCAWCYEDIDLKTGNAEHVSLCVYRLAREWVAVHDSLSTGVG